MPLASCVSKSTTSSILSTPTSGSLNLSTIPSITLVYGSYLNEKSKFICLLEDEGGFPFNCAKKLSNTVLGSGNMNLIPAIILWKNGILGCLVPNIDQKYSL